MAELKRLVLDESVSKDVTAVAMDDNWILVGQVEGYVGALYRKKGKVLFNAKISISPITAVCNEEDDTNVRSIFYAGDEEGNVFAVNKKGEVLVHVTVEGKEPIRVLGCVFSEVENSYGICALTASGESCYHLPWFSDTTTEVKNSYAICASMASGESCFIHQPWYSDRTTEFRIRYTDSAVAECSVDGDGTFYRSREDGKFGVVKYNCDTSARVFATVALEFGEMFQEFRMVYAFAVLDPDYADNISTGTAESCSLQVFDSAQNIIRSLEFETPVIQVQSCRHHSGAVTDKIYILLADGTLYKVNML